MFADEDSTDNPTPQFYQVAETNRQSLNLGPGLVRLISTDARMKMGQHVEGSVTVDNDLPEGVSRWNSDADPYITSITATNIGSKNNGLPGDVIMGYFEPLDASFTTLGFQDDMYFMVVNGLSDINGSAADCEQLIHIEFDFGTSGIDSLERLSRDTGLVEPVTLTHDSGSLYYLDLVLEGGTGDLFKFNNGGDFVSGPYDPAPPGTFLWIADGFGDWATASSWFPAGTPNDPSHTAIFSTGITGPTTVAVNSAVTVNRMEFSNATHGYAVGGLGSVNLAYDPDASVDPSLDVAAGSHQFQAVVNLNHDTDASIATGASLEFANAVNLNGNTLSKTGGGTLIISNTVNTGGGTITGLDGMIAGGGIIAGDLNNNSATVAPGSSPGILSIAGDYTQGSSGTLLIEIAGTALEPDPQYDVLAVSGTAPLDGFLEIDLLNFTPTDGDTFDVVTAGLGITDIGLELTGDDTNFSKSIVGGGSILRLTYGTAGLAGDFDGDGDVDGQDFLLWQRDPGVGNLGDWESNFGTVTASAANSAAVPEPGAIVSLVVGLMAVVGVMRQKRPVA